MLISSSLTYVFLHPFRGGDPFPIDHAQSILPTTMYHDIISNTNTNTSIHTSFSLQVALSSFLD